ncbi:hypothetical protein FGO68_gene2712 [Halteria grandinella]|uniref:Uncharacterized protein n=1 Tax=Halteria grandinella TaxID=5974 RepID=A0A8J8T9P1_HALGN|nr:hypothetical protein FGO68_gene2712 [Halteria grandinella]
MSKQSDFQVSSYQSTQHHEGSTGKIHLRAGRNITSMNSLIQRSKTSMGTGAYQDSDRVSAVTPPPQAGVVPATTIDGELQKIYSQKQYTESTMGMLNQLKSPQPAFKRAIAKTSRTQIYANSSGQNSSRGFNKQGAAEALIQTSTKQSIDNPNKQHLVYLRERFNQIVNEYESHFYQSKRFAEKSQQKQQMREQRSKERQFQSELSSKKQLLKQESLSQWESNLQVNNFIRPQTIYANKMYYMPPPQQADSYHDMLNRPQSQSAKTYFTKRAPATSGQELKSLESRNQNTLQKYSAYTQSAAVSRNNHNSIEKISYFKTEDGHNLVSVQTKTNRHTPDKRMGEPHKNSKSLGQHGKQISQRVHK